MRRASAALRPSGFSQHTPMSSPLPDSMVSTISSMTSTRVKFGEQIHTASISGEATISATVSNTCASPTPSSRASVAASPAVFAVRETIPSTSALRTASNERM